MKSWNEPGDEAIENLGMGLETRLLKIWEWAWGTRLGREQETIGGSLLEAFSKETLRQVATADVLTRHRYNLADETSIYLVKVCECMSLHSGKWRNFKLSLIVVPMATIIRISILWYLASVTHSQLKWVICSR